MFIKSNPLHKLLRHARRRPPNIRASTIARRTKTRKRTSLTFRIPFELNKGNNVTVIDVQEFYDST